MSVFDSDMELVNEVCVVGLRGYADAENHDALQKQFASVIDAKAKAVVLDLSKLSFITSLAIGEFISLYRAKRAQSCAVYMAAPNDYVGAVITKTRLDATLPVYPTVQDAVNALSMPEKY